MAWLCAEQAAKSSTTAPSSAPAPQQAYDGAERCLLPALKPGLCSLHAGFGSPATSKTHAEAHFEEMLGLTERADHVPAPAR